MEDDLRLRNCRSAPVALSDPESRNEEQTKLHTAISHAVSHRAAFRAMLPQILYRRIQNEKNACLAMLQYLPIAKSFSVSQLRRGIKLKQYQDSMNTSRSFNERSRLRNKIDHILYQNRHDLYFIAECQKIPLPVLMRAKDELLTKHASHTNPMYIRRSSFAKLIVTPRVFMFTINEDREHPRILHIDDGYDVWKFMIENMLLNHTPWRHDFIESWKADMAASNLRFSYRVLAILDRIEAFSLKRLCPADIIMLIKYGRKNLKDWPDEYHPFVLKMIENIELERKIAETHLIPDLALLVVQMAG